MILLDTHIWVRWLVAEDVGSQVAHLIENSYEVAVSSISCWEVTYLAKRGRLTLPFHPEKWIEIGLHDVRIYSLPIDRHIATLSASLPDHHRDPADRFIIATAVHYGAQLISFDQKFRKYKELEGLLVW